MICWYKCPFNPWALERSFGGEFGERRLRIRSPSKSGSFEGQGGQLFNSDQVNQKSLTTRIRKTPISSKSLKAPMTVYVWYNPSRCSATVFPLLKQFTKCSIPSHRHIQARWNVRADGGSPVLAGTTESAGASEKSDGAWFLNWFISNPQTNQLLGRMCENVPSILTRRRAGNHNMTLRGAQVATLTYIPINMKLWTFNP